MILNPGQMLLAANKLQSKGQPVEAEIALREIIKGYIKDIEFKGGVPTSWWPMSKKGGVVLDPKLNMGKPTLSECGYKVQTLVSDCKLNELEEVAYWYDLPASEVMKAMRYENYLRSEAAA